MAALSKSSSESPPETNERDQQSARRGDSLGGETSGMGNLDLGVLNPLLESLGLRRKGPTKHVPVFGKLHADVFGLLVLQ